MKSFVDTYIIHALKDWRAEVTVSSLNERNSLWRLFKNLFIIIYMQMWGISSPTLLPFLHPFTSYFFKVPAIFTGTGGCRNYLDLIAMFWIHFHANFPGRSRLPAKKLTAEQRWGMHQEWNRIPRNVGFTSCKTMAAGKYRTKCLILNNIFKSFKINWKK